MVVCLYVGMGGVRGLQHLLGQLLLGVGGALLVLAEDGAGLGAEGGVVVVEVLEAVRLVLDDGGQRLGRPVQVVHGHVELRVRIGVEAQPGDRCVVVLGGVLLRAAEHHVLEEVRVAGAARLGLVAASDAHQRVVGDQAWRVVGDEDQPQAVSQDVRLGRERECLGRCGGRGGPRRRFRRGGGEGEKQAESDGHAGRIL